MTNQQIGPYTLQSLLGQGGMADVYLAWDAANRWPVALKVLRAAPGKEGKLLRRSEREAALLLKLRHPHIVQIYGAGQADDGRYYIAMEYVAGGDLDDLMRRKPGAKLPVNEAVYLMRRVAGAMAYAHEQGIVHRDLKPSNVLLRADTGEPVVTDLGIAAFAGANPLTGTMESLGTPQYMAPEQVAGQIPADGRADVYAIGVMLYELLTARLPFEADNNWAILFRKQQEDAPSVLAARPNLDPRLAAVVDTCLRRDPTARYPTAAALAAALDALLPADAHPPMPVVVKRQGRPTPSSAAAGAVAGVVKTPSNPPIAPVGAMASPAADHQSTAGGRRSPLLWAGGAVLLLLLALVGFWLFGGGGGGGGEPTAAPALAAATDEPPAGADETGQNVAEPRLAGAPTSTAAAVAAQLTDTPPPAEDDAGQSTPTRRATRRAATPTRRATTTPANRAAVTNTPAAEGVAPVLVDPRPAACPPPANAPAYSGSRPIVFRWRLGGAPDDGSTFVVTAGPLGSMREQARIPANAASAANEWSASVATGALYTDGVTDYQWQVTLVTPGGQRTPGQASCFRITSGGGGATQETSAPTHTPRPTTPPVQPSATPAPTVYVPPPTATPQPTAYVEPPTPTVEPTAYVGPPDTPEPTTPPYP